MAGDGRKKINYQIIEPEVAKAEYGLLGTLVSRHHVELAEAKIGLAWRFGFKANKDGQIILGKCKKCGDLEREAHGFDFIIILNYEFWTDPKTTDAQRAALLDHELCHATASMDDESGEAKSDIRNRPVWRCRKHDVEEFREVVERHGIWKQDLLAFAESIHEARMRPLLAQAEKDVQPAPDGGFVAPLPDSLVRAVRDLCPKEGDGIDSISIEVPGQAPAVLTKETRKKLTEKLRKGKTKKAG